MIKEVDGRGVGGMEGKERAFMGSSTTTAAAIDKACSPGRCQPAQPAKPARLNQLYGF